MAPQTTILMDQSTEASGKSTPCTGTGQWAPTSSTRTGSPDRAALGPLRIALTIERYHGDTELAVNMRPENPIVDHLSHLLPSTSKHDRAASAPSRVKPRADPMSAGGKGPSASSKAAVHDRTTPANRLHGPGMKLLEAARCPDCTPGEVVRSTEHRRPPGGQPRMRHGELQQRVRAGGITSSAGANVTARNAPALLTYSIPRTPTRYEALCISPGQHGRLNAPPDGVRYL